MYPIDVDLPQVHTEAIAAIDRAVAAMDALVSTMPDRTIRALKSKRDFGAWTVLSAGRTFARLHTGRTDQTAEGVHLTKTTPETKHTQPFSPTDYGPRGDGFSAHAYLGRIEILKQAWAEADARADEAARAWAQVPGMERIALTLLVAPRPHLKGIRAALNLRGHSIEPDRHGAAEPASAKDWTDADGPRDRLVRFLSSIQKAAPSCGVWAVVRRDVVEGDCAAHRSGRRWDTDAHLVDAGSAEDAITLHQAFSWIEGQQSPAPKPLHTFHAALLAPFEEHIHG